MALRNSAIIAGAVTVLSLLLGSFAGYALARLRLPKKFLILAIFLSISTFPPIAIAAPVFQIWTDIGLYNTYLGLILPSLTFGLPLTIYILASFFREIPRELEEAALIDGATHFQAFRKVVAAAGRSRRGHRRPAGLHLRLERVPVRDHAHQHAGPAGRCRPRSRSSPAASSSRFRLGRLAPRPWSSPCP